jgi:hypothetical protein
VWAEYAAQAQVTAWRAVPVWLVRPWAKLLKARARTHFPSAELKAAQQLAQAAHNGSPQVWPIMASFLYFIFFLLQRILNSFLICWKKKNRQKIRKIVKKIQKYFFPVIENLRDIYGLFLFRCVLWYFYLYFMQFFS